MIGTLLYNKRTKVLVCSFGEMTTSKKSINSWKTKPHIKISNLKKQFFRTWWIKAIGFLRVFKQANLLRRKYSDTFPMISRKQQI